ncbi:hypothetical protein C923_02311 [Plasmodium falciparum UGT5.1]|uniref:Uncharacterized protein n=1 Tax=Plasmodium falciparum UGT5.1 TaxID=1237627 RepID=W7JDL0_PLAFA|nr:hypothetical protein C923_02311 [Plasmodium falciparum UGT5.1]
MNSFIISTYLISKYIIFNMFKHILEIVKINPSTKYADYYIISLFITKQSNMLHNEKIIYNMIQN